MSERRATSFRLRGSLGDNASGSGRFMARTKGSPMERPNKKSNWGGKRPGAGRKCKLEVSDREQIAKGYFARMRRDEERRPARRESVIGELMDEFETTHRMVDRAIAEFLPEMRQNAAIWARATEGMNEIHPLPATESKIKKLKPGMYTDDKLRLTVKSAGNSQWTFLFIWQSIVHRMVLGGSEMSLAVARERATEVSRKIVSGQNPIDGSWSSTDLQKAASLKRGKSKS